MSVARIANANIPDNKRVVISLTYIFGIGRSTAEQIINELKIDQNKRVKDLSDAEISSLRSIIERNYKVEGDLKKEVKANIKDKMDLGSYQGIRHRKSLPVRGQNTHNNARTRKGKVKKVIANKKK
jgi:small subunit ribosomal protein S13